MWLKINLEPSVRYSGNPMATLILFKTKNSHFWGTATILWWNTAYKTCSTLISCCLGWLTCHAVVWGGCISSVPTHIQGLEMLLIWQHVIMQNWEKEKLWESSFELSFCWDWHCQSVTRCMCIPFLPAPTCLCVLVSCWLQLHGFQITVN